jgi:hypothetical protein
LRWLQRLFSAFVSLLSGGCFLSLSGQWRTRSDNALSETPLFAKILTKMGLRWDVCGVGDRIVSFHGELSAVGAIGKDCLDWPVGVPAAIRAKFFPSSRAVIRPYDSTRWVSSCSGVACAYPIVTSSNR